MEYRAAVFHYSAATFRHLTFQTASVCAGLPFLEETRPSQTQNVVVNNDVMSSGHLAVKKLINLIRSKKVFTSGPVIAYFARYILCLIRRASCLVLLGIGNILIM